MATLVITGGTGLVGTALTKALLPQGHEIIILTRSHRTSNQKLLSYAQWDPEKGTIDEEVIRKADAIVHLAGAGVADERWTEKRKKEILDSRVQSGALLAKALREIPNKVQTVVSASAIGYYGPDPQMPNPKPFREGDAADGDFLGRVAQAWEEAIKPAAESCRLVILRIGIVLSPDGGAYPEFRKSFKFGVAGVLGNGKQTVSWIHINDLVKLIIDALKKEERKGMYNAVAPAPVTNRELMMAIRKIVSPRALVVPVPSFALKIVLGGMSIEVLKSTTVSAGKLLHEGFVFDYPDIESAIRQLEAS